MSKEGDLVKVKSLIAEGFDVNVVDNNEMTPQKSINRLLLAKISTILSTIN